MKQTNLHRCHRLMSMHRRATTSGGFLSPRRPSVRPCSRIHVQIGRGSRTVKVPQRWGALVQATCSCLVPTFDRGLDTLHRVSRTLLHHNRNTSYPKGQELPRPPHLIGCADLGRLGICHALKECHRAWPYTSQTIEDSGDKVTA